jgi:hypothetical protein
LTIAIALAMTSSPAGPIQPTLLSGSPREWSDVVVVGGGGSGSNAAASLGAGLTEPPEAVLFCLTSD